MAVPSAVFACCSVEQTVLSHSDVAHYCLGFVIVVHGVMSFALAGFEKCNGLECIMLMLTKICGAWLGR